MDPRWQRERLACLVVAHNLGDAVIQSGFMSELVASGYAERYLVWTRPQVAFLFENLPGCDVICSQFPVGTSKQMGGTALFTFLKAAWQVRRRCPSVTIDLIGDLRDRLFASLAGTPRHLHIGWAEGHPFGRLIRNPFGPGAPLVTVPREVGNVYDSHRLMLARLVPGHDSRPMEPPVPQPGGAAARTGNALRVGLHPFASQACKLWPMESWRQLARDLLARGAKISAFGAPAERASLAALFAEFGGEVRLVAGSMRAFADEAAAVDVMVGLDSFSVHMAQRQGTRSVMINAGNTPELWAPPDGTVLAHSAGCVHYPCGNVPRCEGTPGEYACVKSVEPSEALAAIFSSRALT
jgi:heptosyltransferase III